MLTLVAVPKPFTSPFDVLQQNAIRSWIELGEGVEIVLVGDEAGVAQAARHERISHVPDIARNAYGTPLLDSVFSAAERVANSDTLCFVNADVVLLPDLLSAIRTAKEWRWPWLMVGRRTTVDLGGPLVGSGRWQEQALRIAAEDGVLDPPDHIDYFVFAKGMFSDLPPFAVGRVFYDNWLIWAARKKGPVIDATRMVQVLHQRHDYSHVPEGKSWSYSGPEARQNEQLGGGWSRFLTVADATHVLDAGRIKRASPAARARHRFEVSRRKLIDVTRPIRHATRMDRA